MIKKCKGEIEMLGLQKSKLQHEVHHLVLQKAKAKEEIDHLQIGCDIKILSKWKLEIEAYKLGCQYGSWGPSKYSHLTFYVTKMKLFSYHIQKHKSIKIPFLAFRHSCFPTTTSHSSVQQIVTRKNVVSAIPQQSIINTPGTSTEGRGGLIHEAVKNTVAKKQVDFVTLAT